MNTPILIACAHGTSSPHGAAEVNALRDGIAGLRPGLDVREAYVDVQDPDQARQLLGDGGGDAHQANADRPVRCWPSTSWWISEVPS